MSTEFCWTCEATVDVHKLKGALYCDNCDTLLFDKNGDDRRDAVLHFYKGYVFREDPDGISVFTTADNGTPEVFGEGLYEGLSSFRDAELAVDELLKIIGE